MLATAYPFWADEEIEDRRKRSIELFVQSWGPELQDEFIVIKMECAVVVRQLLATSDYLRELRSDPDFFKRKENRPLLAPARFMTVPQLSEDNFKVIAKALGPVNTLVGFISRERFPWMYDDSNDQPNEELVDRAIDVTAELWAIQLQSTSRRMESSREQERRVREQLTRSKLKYVPPDEMAKRAKELGDRYGPASGITPANLRDLLRPGEFTREHLIAGHKSDVPVLLPSGVLMPTECKVSRSATNSYKRLIRETDGKRRAWKEEFGRGGVQTAAVIGGVYSLKNLKDAQREGMLIFFDHDLDALDAFLSASGTPRAI